MAEQLGKVLPSLISRAADRHPEKEAIIFDGNSLTYAELKESIRRLASGLVSVGVQKGDHIAILLQNSPEFIVSFLAAAMTGAITFPLNINYRKDELTHYLNDSRPKAVIAKSPLVPLLEEVLAEIGLGGSIVVDAGERKDGPYSYSRMIEEGGLFDERPDTSPEDEVLCQYSSGSTGKPKRVVRTHFNLVAEAENFSSTVNVTGADRILCVVPLFHAHGFGNCMLASFYAGATLVILEDFNRQKVLKTLREEKITIFPSVPFIFSILADTPLREKIDASSLRLCFTAGAQLSYDTFIKFRDKFGVHIRQLYGSTETGSVSINLSTDILETAGSVGLPMRNVIVDIFGENGEIIKDGEVGEIGIRSPAMAKGYAGFEDADKEAFRNGYFFPGDLGKKDGNGNLYITGRKTLFINTGGNKVDPSEIEALLGMHPKVKDVAVVGAKGHYGEEVIKAVVVSNDRCDTSEIVEFCRGRIADFKIPRIIEFRNEIPRSPLGKVLRKYLI